MKRIILILAISIFQFYLCFGQEERIVPPSSNAASLGLFGEIPVSPYTGVPDISIPIYTIKSGSITLPINLSYHASGIKVAQEASWVGLGWALEAGGVISRTVCGYDDFGGYPTGFYYEQNLPNVGADDNLNPVNAQNSYYYYNEIANGSKDGEPDMFYFNFNGNSGKFYFQKKGINNSVYPTPICAQRNDLDIKYNISSQNWIVTDGKGYKYYFGTKEITKSYSESFDNVPLYNPNYIVPESTIENNIQPEVVTSWYLDRIESPTGDYITFTYDSKNHPVKSQIFFNEHVHKMITIDQNHIQGGGYISTYLKDFYKQYSYYQTVTKDIYLSQITFNNGKVVFSTTDRSDMEIRSTYWPQSFNAQKLESIEISDNQNTILKCSLNYSYFNDDYSDASYKRLKLNSIDFFDKNIIKKNSYVFGYNTGQLPSKTSNAVDYWGLFNGKGNTQEWGYNQTKYSFNGTFIPSVDEALGGHEIKITGADREVDSEKNQYGILTSIKYPTGGETVFKFESNSYSNFTPFYVDNYTTASIGAGAKFLTKDGTEITNDMAEFTINEPQTIDINYGFIDANITYIYEDTENNTCYFSSSLYGTYAKLYKVNDDNTLTYLKDYSTYGGYPQDNNTIDACYSEKWKPNFSDKQSLQAGKYRIEVIALQANNGNSYYIRAKYKSSQTLISNKLGGGLRIREIKSNSGTYSIVKTYDYTKDGFLSSGKIMSAPSHLYNEYLSETSVIIIPGNVVQYQYAGLYKAGMSSSYFPIGYSAAGNPVGYNVVTETVAGNGKTVYYYHNTADVLANVSDGILPGVPSLSYLNNGLLNKMEIYDNDGNIKTTKENIYTKYAPFNNSVKGVKTYQFPGATTLYVKFYDRVGEWWKLDGTITTNHVGGKQLKVSTTYEYNLKNLLPNKISMQSSTEKTTEKQITYPCDITFRERIYKSMTDNNNMIEYPIEIREYVDGKFVKGELNTFNASHLPYEKYIAETNTPLTSFCIFNVIKDSHYPLLPQIKNNIYGNNGKVNEVIQKDGTIITYLWSYNNEYLIAEIKNATYSDVSNTIPGFISYITSSANPSDIMLNSMSSSLRSGLPNALVTTYTYKPLVGISSMTDPRGVTTRYYYDDFNRLQSIVNTNNQTTQSFDYNYKH